MARSRGLFSEQTRFQLMLVAPAIVVLIAFQVVPIVMGANASFRDWGLANPTREWVGLAHYVEVLTDPVFLKLVLPNTFLFMALSVGLSLMVGLGLALLLNRKFAGRAAVQTMLIVPLMIAPAVAATMIRWIFNDQFGIANVVIEALGFDGVQWLTERWTAFGIIVMTDVWLWSPWFAVLLLAGLQSLPREPFEAALIDGTTRWRTFTHLTLPMLRPVIVVCVVIRTIDAFRTFDVPWILTAGGPARTTELFSLYAYEVAFVELDFGRGSAAALIGAVIILAFGLALYRVLNRLVEVSK